MIKMTTALVVTIFVFNITPAMASSECNPQQIRLAMDVVASNIANATTTRTPDGGPYRRQQLICNPKVCEVVTTSAYIEKYEPGHLDADANGYVKYPDIDLMFEMGDTQSLVAQYEACLSRQ